MNKIVSIIAIISTLAILNGCALFSSKDRPGYQAGRTTAVIWMATEDIQPEELNNALIIGYDILKEVYLTNESDGLMDMAAEALLTKILENTDDDTSLIQKQLIMNFYNMAKGRLDNEVSELTSKATVLDNFVNGIEDALTDYNYFTENDK